MATFHGLTSRLSKRALLLTHIGHQGKGRRRGNGVIAAFGPRSANSAVSLGLFSARGMTRGGRAEYASPAKRWGTVVRFFWVALASLMMMGSAVAQTCTTTPGGSTYCDNGTTGQNFGTTTYWSDGLSSHQLRFRSGNNTFYSNGVTERRFGNTSYLSDGRTCMRFGNTTQCN